MRIKWKKKHLSSVWSIINDLHKQYKVDIVRYESAAWGKTLARAIEMQYWIAYETITPNKDKVVRLKSIVPEFNNWKIFFNPTMDKSLEQELLRFPNYITDDLVDAMVYAIMGNISSWVSKVQNIMKARAKWMSILDKYKI